MPAELPAGLPAAWRQGQRLCIEFADLGIAAARIDAAGASHLTLSVEAYRTAAGTPVAARRWRLEALPGGEWRVRRRLPDRD